jgi:YhcH/YjgK/YiaL family protein
MNQNYEPIRALSQSAYDFVSDALQNEKEVGRYDLENGAYALVQAYVTKQRAEGKYEAHREYIDVQLILSGREIIAIEPLAVMHQHPCLSPYVPDIELFIANDDGEDCLLEAGDFVILRPEDAHMPGLAADEPSPVRKIVIKIPVSK